MSWDPAAHYNPSTGQIEDSCAPSCACDGQCPNGPRVSPRVMIVPVCSPLEADCAAGGPNNGKITITNFLSFFIDGYDDKGKIEIYATLIGAAGEIDKSGGSPPVTGAFLKIPVLVR
jgi:hypothetical protein